MERAIRAFIEKFAKIKAEVINLVSEQFGDGLIGADFTRSPRPMHEPVPLLRTVDPDPARLAARHQREVVAVRQVAMPKTASRLHLDAPDAYAWTLHHLLRNEDVIKNVLFPIAYYQVNGAHWVEQGSDRARYLNRRKQLQR